MPLRILIVDDEPLVRVGIRLILERHENWVVCGEAENGLEAVEKAIGLQPDLIVMDVAMPQLDGIHATTRIKERLPSAPIVILTLHETLTIARLAASAGAAAYVGKSLIAKELIPAIESLTRQEQARSQFPPAI